MNTWPFPTKLPVTPSKPVKFNPDNYDQATF